MSWLISKLSWRRGGGGAPQSSRQQPPSRGDRSSGTNTPSRQDGGRQAMAAYSGNVWGGQDRSRSGSSAGGQAVQGDRARGALGVGPVEEQHVPVREYNAAETREFLKMSRSCLVTRRAGEWSCHSGLVAWLGRCTANLALARGSRAHATSSGRFDWTLADGPWVGYQEAVSAVAGKIFLLLRSVSPRTDADQGTKTTSHCYGNRKAPQRQQSPTRRGHQGVSHVLPPRQSKHFDADS